MRLVSAKVLLQINQEEELSIKARHRTNSDALFSDIPLVISETLSRKKGRWPEMTTPTVESRDVFRVEDY